MAEHGIPDTPQNFWIWHTYHSGAHPDLNRAIDILLTNRREFTDEINEELFERFLGTAREHQVIRETTERVTATLDMLIRAISTASSEASAYGGALRALSVEATSGKPITEVLNTLMTETKMIEQQNQLLQQRLATSSTTIEQLRKNLEDVQRSALTDALTGIANRKHFDQALRDAAMQVMESGDDLALLLIDIDHFKKFNDTWGHQTGDEVLKLVAKILAAGLRECDTPARYGGEEVAGILPGSTASQALATAERIRKAFESKRLVERKSGKEIGNITVSIGAALFEPGEALASLISRADAALYDAKKGGRNRVVIARSPQSKASAN